MRQTHPNVTSTRAISKKKERDSRLFTEKFYTTSHTRNIFYTLYVHKPKSILYHTINEKPGTNEEKEWQLWTKKKKKWNESSEKLRREEVRKQEKLHLKFFLICKMYQKKRRISHLYFTKRYKFLFNKIFFLFGIVKHRIVNSIFSFVSLSPYIQLISPTGNRKKVQKTKKNCNKSQLITIFSLFHFICTIFSFRINKNNTAVFVRLEEGMWFLLLIKWSQVRKSLCNNLYDKINFSLFFFLFSFLIVRRIWLGVEKVWKTRTKGIPNN